MDLKNLASRYSKVSDEMEGNTDALALIRGQAADAVGKNKPSLVESDIRKEAIKPGFLTWRDDQPVLSVKGRAKITGKDFDLESALQNRFEETDKSQPIKQGKPVKEFPNVDAVVVEAEEDDGDEDAAVIVAERKELGQADVSRLDALFSSNLRRALTLTGVFSLGVVAGWWLAKKY